MDDMNKDVEQLVQSYFDCGWEEFEDNAKVKEIVGEMKSLSDIYLKTKASDSSESVKNAAEIEAQLQKLKQELIKLLTKLRSKQKKAKPESEFGDESSGGGSLASKLPLIAAGLSAVALIAAAAAIFMVPSDYASKAELASFKKTIQQSVGQETEAKQAFQTEIDTLKVEVNSLRQELEASKESVGLANQELTDKISSEINKVNLKIGYVQDSLKKGSQKAPAGKPSKPALKSKPAPKKPGKR